MKTLGELTKEEQEIILRPATEKQLKSLTKKELLQLLLCEQKLRTSMEGLIEEEKKEKASLEQLSVTLKKKIFGNSSEKSKYILNPTDPPPEGEDSGKKESSNSNRNSDDKDKKGKNKARKTGKNRNLAPSTRHPDAEIKDIYLADEQLSCPCCQSDMKKTSMEDITEKITFVPAKYIIERKHHPKYRCTQCTEGIASTKSDPSIVPGGVYSDKFIIDIAINKYDFLIPIERQHRIIKEKHLMDLPPHSLIEQTHHLAFYLSGIYHDIKDEVLESNLIHSDDTKHHQLEDVNKRQWYLWQFSTSTACYFEYNDTRSGEMAENFLKESKAIYLMTDVYSGYNRARRNCNKYRRGRLLPFIIELYCNAHARRKFVEVVDTAPESAEFIKDYKDIYKMLKGMTSVNRNRKIRRRVKNIMNKMNRKAKRLLNEYSSHDGMYKACFYFTNNFEGLLRFTSGKNLPIDNNIAERQFRSSVVGRKTWIGTHSKRGSETAAVLFSIIQTCKLNRVDPREYIEYAVNELHQNQRALTPYKYKLKLLSSSELEEDCLQIAC